MRPLFAAPSRADQDHTGPHGECSFGHQLFLPEDHLVRTCFTCPDPHRDERGNWVCDCCEGYIAESFDFVADLIVWHRIDRIITRLVLAQLTPVSDLPRTNEAVVPTADEQA